MSESKTPRTDAKERESEKCTPTLHAHYGWKFASQLETELATARDSVAVRDIFIAERDKRIAELETELAESTKPGNAQHAVALFEIAHECGMPKFSSEPPGQYVRARIVELERAVVADCPRLCADYCNEFQTAQRIAELEKNLEVANLTLKMRPRPYADCAGCAKRDARIAELETNCRRLNGLMDEDEHDTVRRIDALEARLARMTKAAQGVMKIADRNTDEFNALRAALAEQPDDGKVLVPRELTEALQTAGLIAMRRAVETNPTITPFEAAKVGWQGMINAARKEKT